MKVLLRHKPLVTGAVIKLRNSTAASRTRRKAHQVALTRGQTTLPAQTFFSAGVYPVQLRLANRTSRYVILKVT